MKLWPRLGRRRSRLPRKLRATREGKFLIALTLGIGFGAVNSGNNLLYLILGMLLSMIVVSGILSELTLRGVEVRRSYATGLHAGREAYLALELRNTKRRLHSFSVEVEEILEDEGLATQRPAYSLVLGPGEKRSVALKITFSRRGVHRSLGLRIATRFPFSFFRKWREIEAPYELLVYPAVRDVSPSLPSSRSDGLAQSDRRLGRSGEYHGLRDWRRNDDDPRDIHWKSSARRRRLLAREYQLSTDRRLWLLLPNAQAEPGEAARDGVERGITEAASLASHFVTRGWAVGLRTYDGSLEPGTGPGHMVSILGHLARAPVYAPGSGLLALRPLAPPPARDGEHILVRDASQRGLPAEAAHVHECREERLAV